MLQLDPSLAPLPKRVFFDGTLSIIIIISARRSHLEGIILCASEALLDPQSDGICKVELHKIDPKTQPFHLCHPRRQPRNSNLRSLLAPYDTPYVRCRLCLPSIEGHPSTIVQKNKHQQWNEYRIFWKNLNNIQPKLWKVWDTPWPAKFIHGRLGAWQSTEKVYCTYWSPPGNW